MSFFDNYLAKRLQDPKFKKEWEESEEEYLAIRNAIILERLERLEKSPETAIPWKEIKHDSPAAESLIQSLKEMQQIRKGQIETISWEEFLVEEELDEIE